jgi:hypothetical protein
MDKYQVGLKEMTKEEFNQLINYWNFMYPNNMVEPID